MNSLTKHILPRLMHTLMTPDIDHNNFFLSDHDFKGGAVTEINRYRMQRDKAQ